MMKCAIRAAADSNIDLIPPPYDEIYRALGFDGFRVVFDYLGGQSVYVPLMRNVLSCCIKAEAVRECEASGKSPEAVARKYGYTSRHLRRVVCGK